MSIVIVTGTGTDIGKTIATAALAAALGAAGREVHVVKPAQTGFPGERGGDLDTVAELTGVAGLHGYARYPEPMAPLAAADRAGMPALRMADVAEKIRELDAPGRTILVEGAGGLLVRLGDDGEAAGGSHADGGDVPGAPNTDASDTTWALPDLAAHLPGATTVVVTPLELGCLNAAELTVEVARGRGMDVAGLIGGSLPAGEPDPIVAGNLTDLPAVTGVPLLAAIPAGSGGLGRDEFTAAAPGWFTAAGRRWTASESN